MILPARVMVDDVCACGAEDCDCASVGPVQVPSAIVRMRFARTFGALEVVDVMPKGPGWIELREVGFDGKVRARIAIKGEESRRMGAELSDRGRLLAGAEIRERIDPMLRGQ